MLCLGMSALLFTGCSDDDDNGLNVNANDLMKKWYFVATTVDGDTFPYDDHEECGQDYIEFKAAGIMNWVDVWDCEIYSDEYGWTLNGDRLTTIYEGESETVTIVKITETELHVKSKFDYDDDGQDDTVIDKFTSVPLQNF